VQQGVERALGGEGLVGAHAHNVKAGGRGGRYQCRLQVLDAL
jgi:hypothetical protein